jgi:uncharacterized Zn finger protein
VAAFCSQCGAKTSPGDRFCGSCGASVLSTCPTCGQVWDGVLVEEEKPTAKAQPSKKVEQESKSSKLPETNIRTEEVVPFNSHVKFSTAAVDPIYGPLFNPKTDCPNCGTKGQRSNTCKVCDSNNG